MKLLICYVIIEKMNMCGAAQFGIIAPVNVSLSRKNFLLSD